MTYHPLLLTKFSVPPARQSLVPRPPLVERLEAGPREALALISAPAGSGKTTLLSEWRLGPGRDFPVAWVSLDDTMKYALSLGEEYTFQGQQV